MADLLDAISDAREVVKTISSVDDRISLITSQIDTAPKLSQCWSAPIPRLITSQIDTAPKLLGARCRGRVGLITSQIDTALKPCISAPFISGMKRRGRLKSPKGS